LENSRTAKQGLEGKKGALPAGSEVIEKKKSGTIRSSKAQVVKEGKGAWTNG